MTLLDLPILAMADAPQGPMAPSGDPAPGGILMLNYLFDKVTWSIVVWPLVAGCALAVMCAVLSVFVVVKRMAFVGQGVAHSAFGGVGVAAVIAAWNGTNLNSDPTIELVIVTVFCVLAAIGMAAVADRRTVQVDTGIGLFLVASMALGGLLMTFAQKIAAGSGAGGATRSWESVLFGSILSADRADAILAGVVCVLVLGVLLLVRRPMMFYVVDEGSAPAFGVPTPLMRAVLMALLAIATVVAMRLTGVVLSSALLVLPGAIALKMSDRLRLVMLLAVGAALGGVVIGLGVMFQLNTQGGPCIVMTLVVMFAMTLVWNAMRRTPASPAAA